MTFGSGEAVSPARANVSDLITTLLNRSPRLATALAAGQLAWPVGKALHRKARERTTYTIKVLGNDDIYDELHEWVLGLLPPHHQRALVAWTTKRDRLTAIGEDESRRVTAPRLRLRYDGSREQTVLIGGHKIRVQVNDANQPVRDERFKPPEIVFLATSQAAQQQLLAEIAKVAARSQERDRKPLFRMLGKWGDWQRVDDLPDRDLASVVLPSGQLERLVADVERFLTAEQAYVRRCIPWHRGHLYEGPPGTGKTSVARAIASHFGMDIWYLPLADVKKDCDLIGLINRIGPRSMLLLEDADVFHAATQRDDDGERVTLSGLLNALDGIGTPHGLLTVLTTNTPEVLDKAIMRAGRVDLVEHFELADADQVARLLTRWYEMPVTYRGRLAGVGRVSPAQVIEVCKRHDDPAAAVRELTARIRDGSPALDAVR